MHASGFRKRCYDKSLIIRATESDMKIASAFDERSVDENIDIVEQRTHIVVATDFLVGESGVAPDVEPALLYGLRQKNKLLALHERVAAAEGNIEAFGVYFGQNLGYRHFTSGHGIVALRIMTAGAVVGASGKIDGGAQSGAVYGSAANYIQDSHDIALNSENHL